MRDGAATPVLQASRPLSERDWKSRLPLLMCLPLALLSMAVTGFQFGVANNIYHIPYVLDFASSSEFAGQPFAQSLDKFTSALWPLVRWVANEANIRDVFLVLAYASRLLALVAVLYLIATEAGLNAAGRQIACLIVVAATPLLTGYSPIGSHGLFLSYFTHTEATWGPVFLSLALMARKKVGAAAAFTGIAFLLNAFVGLWMVFVNLASTVFHRRRVPAFSEIVTYAVVLALVAAPVLLWISQAVFETRQGVSFSYIEYVREFYPNHFLIEAATLDRLAALAVFFACGLIAALFMDDARYWLGVQFALLALLCVGAVAPYLVNQRFIFNLHFLRADGLVQAVAVVLCAIAGVKLWCAGNSSRQRWMGAIVLVCLLSWPKSLAAIAMPVVALALLAGLAGRADRMPFRKIAAMLRRYEPGLSWLASGGLVGVVLFESVRMERDFHLVARLAFIGAALWLIWKPSASGSSTAQTATKAAAACMALALCVAGLTSYRRAADEAELSASARSRDWDRMLAWVRTSDIHGVFLTSLEMSDEFELRARRPVWVGARQGAAVMWEPSFYAYWLPRFKEVEPLEKAGDLLAYAALHDIRHVMIDTETGDCAVPAERVQQFGRFALCRIGPARGPG